MLSNSLYICAEYLFFSLLTVKFKNDEAYC